MSSSGEVYGMHIMPDRFNADVLLPNGLFMTIPCKREDTLETVKRQLWKLIKTSPANCFDIGDQSSFIFSAVTYDAKLEEFYVESRRLCDLRLFDLILKLTEPKGNKEEKLLNSMIDLAIGKKMNELLLELPREIREEVSDFRKGNMDFEESFSSQIFNGQLFSSYSSYVDVPFKIRIISAMYVNVRNVDVMFVKVGVYHGSECLDLQETTHVEPSNPKWDQWLKFDFHCTDLPPSAKICVSICVVGKKRPKEIFSLGSVNMGLFDYRGLMRSGRIQLNLWPPPKGSEDLLHPLIGLGSNPSADSPCLLLEILSFDRYVVFAPMNDIYSYAAHAIKQEPTIGSEAIKIPTPPSGNIIPSTANNYYTHYSSIRLDFRDRTLSNSCADTKAFIERRLSSSSNNRRDSVSTTYNDNLVSFRSRRPTTSSEKFSEPSSRTSSTASILGRLDSGGMSRPVNSSATSINQSSNLASASMTNNDASPLERTLIASSSQQVMSPVASSSASKQSSISTPISVAESNDFCSTVSESPADQTNPDNPFNDETSVNLVNDLIQSPPFTPLTAQEKKLLWNMRFYCKRIPESLPKLLDAIDWKSRNQLSQLYVLLDEWEKVSLETALHLLDIKYQDSHVRKQAVKWLDLCLDEEMLSYYLLQFVQVLKTEPNLDNVLSSFLNTRALLSPAIGSQFFWYVKSECDEVNDYYNTIRFRYMLERYLRELPTERLSILVRQVQGLDKLMNLAEALKDKTKEDRFKFMQLQLQRVDFTEMLQNIPDPIDHRKFLGELLYDECRIMDSAKRPLWLVWSLPIFTDERKDIYTRNPRSEEDAIAINPRVNKRSYSYSGCKDYSMKEIKSVSKSIIEEDIVSSTGIEVTPSRFSSRTMTSSSDSARGSSVTTASIDASSSSAVSNENSIKSPVASSAIIFKVGDDLRQDMLTLQIIRIVDTLWKQEGLDMCMLAYSCLATGKNVGIIEVVNRAETITSIQKSGGAMSTIQIDSTQLHRWIKERNQDNYDEAIRKFTRSCAGYSVLTFVLGIADRNPDNIMVSEDGKIFHIDFGHFLGHFKKKFGINRERVPFVLTDDFLQVIARGTDARKTGSFDAFRQLCDEAYVSLRKHSNLLITLFSMMLRTGIPELRTLEDISYLRASLQVGVSEEKAREFFQTQFFEAFDGAWATKVDWFFHNIKRI